MNKKRIIIVGGTGLIGKAINERLKHENFDVKVWSRRDMQKNTSEISENLRNAHGIINLAGEPILQRWTTNSKYRIQNSRIGMVNKLVEAIEKISESNERPHCFISASAIGIYASSGKHTETNYIYNTGFVGELCQSWEQSIRKVQNLHIRHAIFRLGVVLSTKGGYLDKILPIFQKGLGGRVGSGKQTLSFIHIDDVVEAFRLALLEQKIHGAYNLTAPHPITNKTFTKELGRQLKCPTRLPVPAFAIRMLYGEASELILKGGKVYPQRLLEEGFTFKFPCLKNTLSDLLKS